MSGMRCDMSDGSHMPSSARADVHENAMMHDMMAVNLILIVSVLDQLSKYLSEFRFKHSSVEIGLLFQRKRVGA